MTPVWTFSHVRSGEESPSLMKFVSSRINQGEANVRTDPHIPSVTCMQIKPVNELNMARSSAFLLPA